MLIPMGARAHRPGLFLRLRSAPSTSVAGGVLGYAIGYFLTICSGVAHAALRLRRQGRGLPRGLCEWGAWIILLKGMTPIPYKIVTITSGFAPLSDPSVHRRYRSLRAACASICVAFLIHRYGDRARVIIEERLEFWAMLFGILLIGGIVVAVYLV